MKYFRSYRFIVVSFAVAFLLLLALVLFGNPQYSRFFYYAQSMVFNKGKPLEAPRGERYTGIWKCWDGMTLIAVGSYKDGVLNGLSEYMPEGILESRTTYINGTMHGPFEFYYPSGLIYLRGSFDLESLAGPFEMWYKNGQLAMSGSYRFGKRDGNWKVWDEGGRLVANGVYKIGVPFDGTFTSHKQSTGNFGLPNFSIIEKWENGSFIKLSE